MHRAALPPSHTMCGLLSSSCFAFTLHPFMRCILFLLSCISQALFIHMLHPSSPFMYPPGFIHSCTSFCLSLHVLAGTQLYVQEIRTDGYKTPCWPIRSLFSLVHIAWMHIFISLYFSQGLTRCEQRDNLISSVRYNYAHPWFENGLQCQKNSTPAKILWNLIACG